MSARSPKPHFRDKFLLPIKNLSRRSSPGLPPASSPTADAESTPIMNDPEPSSAVHVVSDQSSNQAQSYSGSATRAQSLYETLLPSSSPAISTLPTRGEKTRRLRTLGWVGLKEALALLERASDAFPPLKSAVAGIMGIVQHVENVQGVQTDFSELIKRLGVLTEILRPYQAELPPDLRRRLDGLTRAFDGKKDELEKKIRRSLLSRSLEASGDAQDIVQGFRYISCAIEIFTMDISLSTNIAATRTNTAITKAVRNATLDKLGHVAGAEFNLEDREGCMEGTRIALLADLLVWATDDTSPHVFWLNGMAGTGKTTIAESFARLLNQKGLLGASFFCSRQGSAERRNARRIFPALARVMARHSPAFESALVGAVDSNPNAAELSLGEQFVTLIAEPAESASIECTVTWVAVVDALDECEDPDATKKVLDTIIHHAPGSDVKFFVTSRPEPNVRAAFDRPTSHSHSVLRLHNVEADIVKADIMLYLEKQLGDIPQLKASFHGPGDLRILKQVGILIERSERLFIFAFTAYEYVKDPKGDPRERLEKLTRPGFDSKVATARIDTVYDLILGEAFKGLDEDEESETARSLAAIVCVRDPLSIDDLQKLLDCKNVRRALASLHSLVQVPEPDADGCVSTFHASFADYLLDPKRSGDQKWTVDSPYTHSALAHGCLKIMTSELHFNVSGIQNSHFSNRDPEESTGLPRHLVYACRFWVDHLVGSSALEEHLADVEAFLRDKYLYWLEVMSMLGKIPDARSALLQIARVSCISHDMGVLLKDFNQFAMTYRDPIILSAAHIYISALPFAGAESSVTKIFRTRFPRTLAVNTSTARVKSQYRVSIVVENGDSVNSVVFSPDGKRIVSGSRDQSIRVWDAETGEAASEPFKGHTSVVSSVAFSPDGKCIVSGSYDKTIRVWDVETGETASKPFQGHTGMVTTVTFSPDGKRIVSGSKDNTIRVWDAEMGEAASEPFEGHIGEVASVAYSQDGKRIISGSSDETIRMWNAETGKATSKPFRGHTSVVSSVAFSPDGKHIISGSWDTTIRVWDTETGETAFEPFKGHTHVVTSVAFSPDGKHVVSSSLDKTIRVWNAETGEAAFESFRGHTSVVSSVAFSPDGKRIVSGSYDVTIRVWDAKTGEAAS
ncbi:hypothetical protein EW146_g9973, partial [Bondarzewia mesenterica]